MSGRNRLSAMAEATGRRRVLFVCTHNSARSQMAEGLLQALGGAGWEALSAGTEATRLRPEAAAVMREVGVDIDGQSSKTIAQFLDQAFDWVITVCDAARESCPFVPGARRTAHWSIADPAAVVGSEGARLEAFRAARDELRRRIESFVEAAGEVAGTEGASRP